MLRIQSIIVCCLLSVGQYWGAAQQLAQDKTPYNRSSLRGMPLTDDNTGIPLDQNGDEIPEADKDLYPYRAPFSSEQATNGGTTSVPASGQFRAIYSPSTYLPPIPAGTANSSVAEVYEGTGKYRLRSATMAAPYFGRKSSYQFGDVIAAPDKDESGSALDSPEEYWFAQPYVDEESYIGAQTSLGWYWSPHAQKVFAVESGSISISWQKRIPSAADSGLFSLKTGSSYRYQLEDGSDGLEYVKDSGSNYYALQTINYSILGTAVKTPQVVYWNEGDYNGPDVIIDQGAVGDFHLIYTDDFPAEVVTGTQTGLSGNEEDVLEKTLWVDKQGGIWQVKAQLRTGRVFAEILGDPKGNGTRQFLGFEIIDVKDIAIPDLVQIELGEPLVSGADIVPESGLMPQPVNLVSSLNFTYRQVIEGTDIPELWATHLTENTGDLEIYWMSEGVEGIRWPYHFSRYQLVWPTDYSKYSHYVRPSSNINGQAEATAVAMPGDMVPTIEEQDVIPGGGAFIGENSRFYTIVTETHPAHRTLLRYNAGSEVAFERVFSWRTDELKQMSSVDAEHPYTVVGRDYNNSDPDFANIGYPRYVAITGNYVFVTNYNGDSVMTFDISDMENIRVAHTILHDGSIQYQLNGPLSVVVDESKMYFGSVSHTVNQWDISNPASPEFGFRIRDGVEANYILRPERLAVDGDYLYVLSNNDDSFTSLRISTVETGVGIGSLSEFTVGDSMGSLVWNNTNPSTIALSDGVAYVTDADNKELYVIDVTDPIQPEIIRIYGNSDVGFENLDVVWGGSVIYQNYLFLGMANTDRVQIYDVSDPANITLVKELIQNQDGYTGLNGVHYIARHDDVIAIVGRYSDAVTMVDVSDPANPVLLEKIDYSAFGLQTVTTIDFDGETLVLPCELTNQIAFLKWQDPRIERWNADPFEGSVAENLDVFRGEFGNSTLPNGGSSYFEWADSSNWEDNPQVIPPRFVEETAYVGKRINAPNLEIGHGSGEDYLAGYIYQPSGTSFNPNAYVNPLDTLTSLEDSALGAIIPVNAIPGSDRLEVWWMRDNNADTAAGFGTIYWPSVVGYYDLEWPDDAREIVLASNDGSGALSSLLAAGNIYYENTPEAIGYNPNEEHALRIGGQIYALRDDLNLTDDLTQNPDGAYSSEPFVLLEYTAADGRPGMEVFQVLLEKPEEGLVFNYLVEAGAGPIQAPMPLPFLGVPLYDDAESPEETLNRETGAALVESNTANALAPTTLSTASEFAAFAGRFYVLEGATADGSGWLPTRGALVASVTDMQTMTAYVGTTELIPVEHREFVQWREGGSMSYPVEHAEVFAAGDRDWGTPGSTEIVLFAPTTMEFKVLTLLDAFENRIFLRAEGSSADTSLDKVEYAMILDDAASLDLSNWTISQSTVPRSSRSGSDLASLYQKFTFVDRKGNVWPYRGPHEAQNGAITGSGFSMQFHYATQEGFAFPSSPTEVPVGTLTPYLRALGDSGYRGDPIDVEEYGSGVTQAAPISYSPQWPTNVAELKQGKTLTTAYQGMDGIRGQSSAEVIYEQSIALNDLSAANESVVLHDPTREKRFYLGVDGDLSEIPATIETDLYLGDTYFPALPPHLSSRFYFNPNLGAQGALVFKGEFVENNSEDYILSNVIGQGDLETLRELIDVNAEESTVVQNWYDAIEGLSTRMELFVEQSGVYVVSPDENDHLDIGFDEVSRVDNDDIAVDSYALTASGAGSGYVTILTGNGNAFTDPNDPVGMFVIRVVDELHDGFLDVVPSGNPLSEKLTMTQTVDLTGGALDDFVFEWKIASPVNGTAPGVANASVVESLLGSTGWNHIAFPSITDTAGVIPNVESRRASALDLGTLSALSSLSVSSWSAIADDGNANTYESEFTLNFAAEHGLAIGELLAIESGADWISYRVDAIGGDNLSVDISQYDPSQTGLTDLNGLALAEMRSAGTPDSILHQTFTTTEDVYFDPTALWLGLDQSSNYGVEIYINGEKVVSAGMNEMDSSVSDSVPRTAPTTANASSFNNAYYIDPSILDSGTLTDTTWSHEIVVFVYANDEAQLDTSYILDLSLDLEQYQEIQQDEGWIDLAASRYPDGVRAILGGTANVQSLSDNYLIMRYGKKDTDDLDGDGDLDEVVQYSQWTNPQLAEGWIKRVLDGINPFDQRVTDLFNNAIETDASILTLAGPRWEGDVALNSETINDFGLIEIYETVLNRGKGLSIDAGINFGPANDALLLAAGYLNDLYMMLGNEAWADSLNPTIGISTADGALGNMATASFSFEGQVASLLEEELSLLRGRDDFLPPGVEGSPVYNRLFWNYTRGIDSGEIIYALNYNILEDQDDAVDGIIDAADAQALYPQGHGDAYGHYLTAIKNYYKLIMDEDFDWVPRTEAVLILGQTVQVDYTDERKFAAAAAALGETGSQIVDLTWRKDYESGDNVGWNHFNKGAIRENESTGVTRYWGLDHWATRVAQGTYLNWVVGNSMLEEVDSDPTHEGIQVVDRQTVPELIELTYLGESVQNSMDSAEAHLNPLGLTEGSVPFDIKPVSSFEIGANRTHFEQIYDRAVAALQNAVTAFDAAKDVTALMRSETDSLAEFQSDVEAQELAYTNQLIEIYGTPYADDIGVGATYVTDYEGPDLVNYNMVDLNELTIPNWINPKEDKSFTISSIVDANQNPFAQSYQAIINKSLVDLETVDGILNEEFANGELDSDYWESLYTLNAHGFFDKPAGWGSRESPGQIQASIGEIILATNDLREALENYNALVYEFQRKMELFLAEVETHDEIRGVQRYINASSSFYNSVKALNDVLSFITQEREDLAESGFDAVSESLPRNTIIGLSNGGDLVYGARASLESAELLAEAEASSTQIALAFLTSAAERAHDEITTWVPFNEIAPLEWAQSQRQSLFDLDMALGDVQLSIFAINSKVQKLAGSRANYKTLIAKGNRIQAEREVFRKRAAAVIQGYRTRDAAFRVFRDEKLERYKTLFDLASQFTFMAAQAYDYETGLLHTDEGRAFIDRIVASRALGVMENGSPQFGGSSSGDPGLSSVLAEMNADWQVLRGRLGHNNPDTERTVVSLRAENYRILPGVDSDPEWKDVLHASWVEDLRTDEDLVRHCLQLDDGDARPVPGLVIEFSTTITKGLNLFGNSLSGGDHYFSPTSYATKVFSIGVALEGYPGISDPSANSATTGGSSVADPDAFFFDPESLAATPHVYLIPVGLDAMKSPPLGDTSVIRTWEVEDLTIPLPFNIGASEFSTHPFYKSSDSLTEPLFGIRKHQAFRAVGSVDAFPDNGRLMSSVYTNTRLMGRSIWNTHWKLVIPGWALLDDPDRGLQIFIDHVKDIKLNLETVSYSGN